MAVDVFERVGNFKETMAWDDYMTFLAAWMPTADWACSFKRITEAGNLVFLELEERAGGGAVNSASIYEFDESGQASAPATSTSTSSTRDFPWCPTAAICPSVHRRRLSAQVDRLPPSRAVP